MEKESCKCTYCGKAIISFKARDWKGRKLHRTCYHKEIADWQYANFILELERAHPQKEASN